MNDKVRLYIYGITAEEWIRRYGMEPFSYPCYHCARILTTSIPFAQGTLRGLQAPVCECGDEKTPYVIVRDPKYGDLFTGSEIETSVDPENMGKVLYMKKPTKKHRNPAAIPAKTRTSGGPMRNKKDKRKNGKNKQQKYLEENY